MESSKSLSSKAVSLPLNVFVAQNFLGSISDTSFSDIRSFCLHGICNVSFWIQLSVLFFFFPYFSESEGREGERMSCCLSKRVHFGVFSRYMQAKPASVLFKFPSLLTGFLSFFVFVLSLHPTRKSLNFTGNFQI